MIWQVAEAKNKLNEVITKALTDGPRRIRRRNETVVVVAEADYERLVGDKPSFTEFLLNGPDLSDLDLTRDPHPMRDVEL